MNFIRLSIYLILIFTNIILAGATLQDLLNSYNYNFYNGTINVTNQQDYMINKNSDNKNDTLIINITTNAATAGTYKFIVEITDEDGILINDTLKLITASDKSASINFPSELLTKQKFNYSIRVNDNNNNLVFRKYNVESQTYKNYETGINITKITDENVNNNLIRINLTINSPQATTANITVTLAYNSSTISKIEEKNLIVGVQTVSIDFDNETIKSTHYNSNFTVDTIVVGNKIFDFNKNTSIYNYEHFAKTSYIKSITDSKIDTNNNNLSEFLEINFTLEIKNADTYILSYDLYDQFDNFVTNNSKTETLSAGTKNLRTLINGSDIYKTKINGPYILSFAKLSVGNNVEDIIFGAHTTNQSYYTDYERPNLPDLKVTIKTVFDDKNNLTNITINLSNIGNAPAFNIFLDIFNNLTYNKNTTLAFLSNNNFVIYNFTATNTSNITLFTAIVDFDNLVDESDESNNIANSLTIVTNDLDGDGISDDTDTLIGNENSINTTIANLTIKIGDASNLSQAFNGTHKISFIENGTIIMEFDFNLSKILNLTSIMIEKQSNNSFGYTLVHGLSLVNNTKTVYVDRIDNTINGVCIKDAEVTSISQVSNECNDANETRVECDSTLQSSYTCNYNSTTNKYKITGLNHSGIKQIDYTQDSGTTAASSASGGAGGGSSGGSGSCLENWQCTTWSNCINNLQTRSCQDINRCRTIFNKPRETELCAIEEKISEKIGLIEELKESNNAKSKNKYSLPDITGFLLNPPENANPNIGALIVFVIIVIGMFSYFYFVHKK